MRAQACANRQVRNYGRHIAKGGKHNGEYNASLHWEYNTIERSETVKPLSLYCVCPLLQYGVRNYELALFATNVGRR